MRAGKVSGQRGLTGDDVDDDAAGSGGDSDLSGLFCTVEAAVPDALQVNEVLFLIDEVADDVADEAGYNAHHTGAHQGGAADDHDDEDNSGQQQVQAGKDGALDLDLSVLLLSCVLVLGSQTIHQHKDGEIVSDSRQDGSSSDAAVRDTQHLSPDECADAHVGGQI